MKTTAKTLFKNNNVFKKSNGKIIDIYICKGTQQPFYEVLHNKISNKYTCNCNNVRTVDCKHIKAVKILKGVIQYA